MDELRIRNRMQTDLYPDQINIVQATDGRSRATLLFTGADWSKPLPLTAVSAAPSAGSSYQPPTRCASKRS